MSEQAAPAPVTAARQSRSRSVAVLFLVVVGGLFLLLASFAVWVDRVALNTDVFVRTSTELIEDDAIRQAVAVRAVDELYASVDVKELIEEQAPEDLDSLAGVAAAGARQALYQILDRALRQPTLQRLWSFSLRESHTTLVQVLEERSGVVTTDEGVVVLDLRPLMLDAAERLGIREQVEERLAPEAGRIEVLTSDDLDTAQDAFRLLKTLAWILPLLTVASFGGALWVALDRRRAVRSIGIAIAVVGALGLVAANVTGNYLVTSLVADTESRQAAGDAWDIVTELLRSSFRWLVAIGILFVVASWLAGPGRRAVASRRLLAPAFGNRIWAYAALGVVGLVLLLTAPADDFALLLVVAALVVLGAGWIEITRAQTRREFPDASGSDLLDDLRARMGTWWTTIRAGATSRVSGPLPTTVDFTERLARLAELHARGDLTDEEYTAAKSRVLAGE